MVNNSVIKSCKHYFRFKTEWFKAALNFKSEPIRGSIQENVILWFPNITYQQEVTARCIAFVNGHNWSNKTQIRDEMKDRVW